MARFAQERVGAFNLPVIRRGMDSGPLVIFAQPLFEEHNRCRKFLSDIARALANLGIGSALPDLPCTGDHTEMSPFDLELAQEAFSAFVHAQSAQVFVLSLRGGALLAGDGVSHTALAPVWRGARLLVDLIRAHGIGERERTGKPFGRQDAEQAWARGETCRLAGYDVTPALAAQLMDRTEATTDSIATIGGENADYEGPPVWRQADPVDAAGLASEIAHDLAARVTT
ncbi:MAG: hypothetical protein WA979_12540 [Pacificimonas sp.]